ncbi:2-hydroxy-3-oxopropionate reductase [Rathayibacter oskolensis]|uniref:2-hydroxy-3-oxopropionate reductase n=1 Tax=Rathayibacter oskolensis TaxID=1891671 RepID=A0A1X7PD34_9MICO|nr:NAD(P)-dependent oxidoreductase [Rathayibacter oskolensis]SMH49010.1 2-hydroxy-3-oxopropionate reductase [Rathayibacter oskolensis]
MQVAFIGLGDIGLPMALSLRDAGFRVSGADLDDRPVQRLREAGGEGVAQPRDLASCEVVCVAVPDDDAVESVLFGSGLIDELESGTHVLLHSTLLPPTVIRLAEEASARGVSLHDAPVSGGAARARKGELTIMLGGDAGPSGRTVLEALGSVVAAGPVGAGAALKLANQLSMLAALQALYEGLALAEEFGVDRSVALSTLEGATGDSWVARNWGFFDKLALDYDRSGTPVEYRPWSKDLWDIVATGRQSKLSLPLAALLSQILATSVEERAHRDSTEVAA